MRPHGKTKLGFFPLPVAEAVRLRSLLIFKCEFSAVDPCVGDGVAFAHMLKETQARRYGIEIDANRAQQAKELGIEIVHEDVMDVRCPVSLPFLCHKEAEPVRPGWWPARQPGRC